MHLRILLFVLLLPFWSFSQNYENVDKIVSNYPSDFLKIEDLVLKVNNDFQSSLDKSRAVFYWVCTNIKYDINLLKKVEILENAFSYKTQNELVEKEKKFNHDAAVSAFKNKSAICFGYAALCSEILNKMGIESKVVRGNLKGDPSQIGKSLDLNHGWNMIRINNEWKLVDCTLGAGRISSKTQQFVFDYNDVYFFTKPELFYSNHYPSNSNDLGGFKITKADYINYPIYFPDFFKNPEMITLPKTGNISSKELFSVQLKNFNIDYDYLEYKFSNDSQRSLFEVDPNTLNGTIILNNKANQTLNLYLNNKLIALYNVI